jgi:hypothetical protein
MENSKKTLVGTIIIAAVLVIVGIVGTTYVVKQKDAQIESLSMEKSDLYQQMQQRDSVMNDLENTFTEIENNLSFIKEKRSKVSLTEAEGGKNRKQALLEDVNLMNTMLEESEKKIADLEQKLKKSGLNMKAYEKRLQALNETIESQNTEIAELKKMIEDKNISLAELNTKVENMNFDMQKQADTISYKQNQIVKKTDQLNTAHVVTGTFKELKDEGIIDREGGLLGIGSSKAIQENFDPKHFTELDIRQTKTIPLNSKKARVISEHPLNSYSLVEENGQVAYLQIENPEEFWRISKYAVIQVK